MNQLLPIDQTFTYKHQLLPISTKFVLGIESPPMHPSIALALHILILICVNAEKLMLIGRSLCQWVEVGS